MMRGATRLLYDEHTWTFVSATTQPEHHQSEDQIALKRSRVIRARDDIKESIQREWAQLEALVKTKDSSVAVFNSLNWPRNGIVETDLPEGATLVDASTGAEVPVEILWKGKGISLPGFGPGSVRVRFLAAAVPAVGYKVYAIKPISKEPAPSEEIHGNILENPFYRITLDPSSGSIASVFDKHLGRELVDRSSPYKFGQYLYVTGGDSYPNNSLYRFGAGLKPPSLTVHPAQSGMLLSAKKTSIGIVATMNSSAPNTPSIQTEILMPDSEKAILHYVSLAQGTRAHERVGVRGVSFFRRQSGVHVRFADGVGQSSERRACREEAANGTYPRPGPRFTIHK